MHPRSPKSETFPAVTKIAFWLEKLPTHSLEPGRDSDLPLLRSSSGLFLWLRVRKAAGRGHFAVPAAKLASARNQKSGSFYILPRMLQAPFCRECFGKPPVVFRKSPWCIRSGSSYSIVSLSEPFQHHQYLGSL